MEVDGLVTHTAAGGRKTYEITDAGRAELRDRAAELAALETEIHASVADLAAVSEQVEQGVRGSVRDLKKELKQAAQQARRPRSEDWRQWRDSAETSPPGPPPVTEVERRAAELVSDVRRWVQAGRASSDDLRVAAQLLDSVRDQIRRLLHG
jgi:hypothetical protein